MLAKMGIRTVLDLRGGPIHKPRERKEVEAAGMEYTSIRLSGFFEPKDKQIRQILTILEDPSKAPIFMHCRRGDDRVGLVIACYRIAHDHWTNEQALAEACEHGISPFEVLMRRYARHFDPSRLHLPTVAQRSLRSETGANNSPAVVLDRSSPNEYAVASAPNLTGTIPR